MERTNTLTLAAGSNAFGDGAHPTTAGVMAALEAIDPSVWRPRIACDIGCGSGILAFAMLALFGCPVIATDISSEAVAITTRNAAENKIATCTYAEAGAPCSIPPHTLLALQADGFNHPALQAAAPFDLIVMNILADPLLRLATAANTHLAADGVLILSGILQWQEPQIQQAYQSLGLELTSRLTLGDWVTLTWQKPS